MDDKEYAEWEAMAIQSVKDFEKKTRRKYKRKKKREEKAKEIRSRLDVNLEDIEGERKRGLEDFFYFVQTHLQNLAYDDYFHGLLARFIEHGHSRMIPPGDYYWPSREALINSGGQVTAEYRIGDPNIPLSDRLSQDPTNLDGSWRGYFMRVTDDEYATWKEVLVPRGHLKTTFATVGRFLWHIVREPATRQLLNMNSGPNANLRVREMKAHFERNEVFRTIYRDVIPDFLLEEGAKKPPGMNWRMNTFDVKKPDDIDKTATHMMSAESSVFASGVGTRKTSQHYPYLNYDDLVDDDVIGTAEMLQKNVNDFVATLDLSIGDTSRYFYIGTPWHYADISQAMLDPNELGIEKLNVVIATVEDYQGIPMYPKNEHISGHPGMTRQKIKRKKTGRATRAQFSSQQLMQPVSSEEQQFPASGWKWYREADLAPVISTVISVDPAISEKARADYTVYAVISSDIQGNWYVREIVREHGISLFEEQIYALWQKYRPDMIGIEGVGFQRTLEKLLMDAALTRGRPMLPIHMCTPSTRQSKEFRISRIIPRFQAGMIFLPAGDESLPLDIDSQRHCVPDGIAALINEGERFPKGRHDDALEAVSQAIEFTYQPAEFKARDEEPRTMHDRVRRDIQAQLARQGRARNRVNDPVLGTYGVDYF